MRTTIIGAVVALTTGMGFGQADVISGVLTGVNQSGGNGPLHLGSEGDLVAYSIGTTSCNVGTVPLNWFQSGADRHPLIITNIYRIDHGAIEQIGVSWVKHGFCALQQTACGSCSAVCGGCCSQLGVGCSDPYSASLNGSQTGLGPRYEINCATGEYPWPFDTAGQSGNNTFKRLQVHVDDLDPLLNPNALYVGEAQYVAKDDADAGNDDNNASHRMIVIGNENPFFGGWFINYDGPTVREEPAIFAWQDADPNVQLTPVDVPGDGRFWVGANATDNGDGTWHYEYAVHNLNSDRNAGSFGVETGASPTNVGFRDVDYHSGEPFDMTDWAASVGGGEVSWSNGTTWTTNQNANAVRWGTLYNFRFDAPSPPVDGTATIGLFGPGGGGDPDSVTLTVPVPEFAQGGCNLADLVEPFGVLDLLDVQAFIAAFTTADLLADMNGDGILDLVDVQMFIADFLAGCP
ncbi:MAG: hypothetical protein K8E66_02635 [Phycisphaerales bacterium]|nr:hypothetical protein [Phycisphaerales bacterium]